MKTLALTSISIAAALLLGCGGNSGSGGNGGGGASSASSSGTNGTGGAATSSSSGSNNTGPCMAGGAEISTLPTCASPASAPITVKAGCTPTVDGKLTKEEWSDGTCFTVGNLDMTVVVKYAGDSLYMANAGPPTCGCPMQFFFNLADTSNFVIPLFDDPFMTDGDRSNDFTLTSMGLKMAPKNSAIQVMCPGNQPTPIRYEWKIPLSALQVTPGMKGQFKLAIDHAGVVWPSGLSLDAMMIPVYAPDEPTWGVITSPSWQ